MQGTKKHVHCTYFIVPFVGLGNVFYLMTTTETPAGCLKEILLFKRISKAAI